MSIRLAFATAVALGVVCMASSVVAQEAKVTMEPVVSGLTNPTGVAVQPGSQSVFIADSGNLQVVRLNPSNGRVRPIITGYSKDVYGKGPMYDIGPLGLAFLSRTRLVVGDGGRVDGMETMAVYDLPSGPMGNMQLPLAAEKTAQVLGPIGPGEDSPKGEGNLYAIAVTPEGIWVTCNGDDTKGWISLAPMTDGKIGELKPRIKTKVATGVDAPVAITVNPDGNLVVGQMGEVNSPGDSRITIYSPKTGEMLADAETGLHDIAGLAYHPKTGALYGVDFAWVDPKQGGLYRFDLSTSGGKLTATPVKILALDKPSSLAFDAEGTLYVAVFGTASDGSTKGSGQVVKITGDLK